jgi:hypothetical protein
MTASTKLSGDRPQLHARRHHRSVSPRGEESALSLVVQPLHRPQRKLPSPAIEEFRIIWRSEVRFGSERLLPVRDVEADVATAMRVDHQRIRLRRGRLPRHGAVASHRLAFCRSRHVRVRSFCPRAALGHRAYIVCDLPHLRQRPALSGGAMDDLCEIMSWPIGELDPVRLSVRMQVTRTIFTLCLKAVLDGTLGREAARERNRERVLAEMARCEFGTSDEA